MKIKSKIIWNIILIFAIIIFFVSAALLICFFISKDKTDYDKYKNSEISQVNSENSALADNPINFEALWQQNTDVYAWINIPSCSIDYPIVQSYEEDDSFYLHHNLEKQYQYSGCIYTEKLNKKDFNDRNTVIYGHNMLDGTMFSNLLAYQEEAFFNDNPYIYIYMPGHKLTYMIFSAYRYDNRHILNSFDFSNDEVWETYLEEAKNPKSLVVNKRDVNVTTDDKIITLSTCTGSNFEYRYLIQGVLINDELTK